MRQSVLFPKTQKLPPKDAESVNHKLLVRAGFIDQLMTGSWTLLPLGLKVVSKINQIIREEMNETGANEILIPLLHPKNIWNETGRWESAREVMYQFKDAREKEYALSFTCEEIVLDLVRKHLKTYRDLPLALYHFSTKFRNELRAKSGILRGREFMMKDLYSVHADEEDFWKYYESVRKAYSKIFKRIGFDFRITESGGGIFTDNITHEFQVVTEGGEDTIFYCDKCDWGQNQELFKGKEGDVCPECRKGSILKSKSIEVGNIFPFGTYYSEKMNVVFTGKDGSVKHPFFGSYGIGSTRAMGAWVEVSHDDRGIIWSKSISPFDVHLLQLKNEKTQNWEKEIEVVYEKLVKAGVDVLWDERDVSAGEKFADADLLGIPVRLLVSGDTDGKIEWKGRTSDIKELLSLEEVIKKIR